MSPRTYKLPGGFVDEAGIVHQEVELIPLCGRDEELLATNHRQESASLVTNVLSRCVRRVGTINPVSEAVTRQLLTADRQYLLLKLRELTFGDRVQAAIFCPWQDCGKKVGLDFSLNNIPIHESVEKGPLYKIELSAAAAFIGDDGQSYREITFRLPNGGDQEAISPLLSENEASALTKLLVRCIQNIGPLNNPGEEIISRLSPLARLEIERQMEKVAPKVELTMEASCPECSREFAVPFDLQNFFFGEFRTSLDLLYREIHYLAYHYHWSEQEIMEMPKEKRRRYIDVLADEIERLNNAV
jgi:hypothetical protein